jgi:phage shock protein C
MGVSPRRLTRSRTDRRIAGVCGGLARYYGWDPTLVRVGYVVASVVSVGFPGIAVYLLLWILMPQGE